MSLTDALAAGPRRTHRGPVCSIKRLLDRLDDDLRGQLVEALRPESPWPHAELARVLADNMKDDLAALGIDVKSTTVGRHRRGECSCEPR